MTRTAIVTDKTPSRGTVAAFVDEPELGPSDEELEAIGTTRGSGDAWWHLREITDDTVRVGDRIWLES